MSVYVYLFHDRIIYWSPQTMYSKPANVPSITWYSVSGAIPMPLNDMITRGNVGYNLQKGFYTVEGNPPPAWEERERFVKYIQVINAFNSVSNTQRARYTDNTLGQALVDILTIDELREYKATNSLENCPIMTSLLETYDSALTPDALATKLSLRYESYKTVTAYLNRLEYQVRVLCNQRQFDAANDLVNNELEKMRM